MVDDLSLLAILGSLNESDGDDTLGDMRYGLDNLEALSDPQLTSLICSKEGIAKMKDRIVVEDPVMRAMFISRLGKVIVRTLLVVGAESFDIEGYVRVESRTESRRMVEDFLDMATDVMKSFALGALGRAPAADSSQIFPDSIECCNAYCEVLTLLLTSYNSAFEPLDAWTDALTGVAGSGSLGVHTASRVAVRSSALSLLPVLKPALGIVFRDRYHLMSRCRQLPSYSYAPLRLVSAFMRTLLTDVSYTASILTVLNSAESESGAGQNIFGIGGSGDSLEGTRLSGPSLPIQPYIAEWVHTVLLRLLVEHVVSGEDNAVLELCAVLKDVICLTQHRIMTVTRQQVAGPVLQKLFYLLENYTALSTHHAAVPTYAELSCWALLMMRYTAHMDTPGNSGAQESAGSDKSAHSASVHNSNPENAPGKVEFVTYHYHLRLFKIICEITDVVTQTRLFAEFCMVLLHRSMHEELDLALNASEEWERFSASRTGYKFTVTLPSAILRSHPVRQLLESGTRTAPNAVLARFVTALCDTYHTLLQYTLTPVLVLWPEVLRTQAGAAGTQATQKGKAVEKVTDFLDFAPTTVASAGTAAKAAVQCDPLYVPTLQAHLDGTQELLHPWVMLHDQLCTSGIKRSCSVIHTLLYPAAADARITPGIALDAKTVAARVKAEYTKLVEILVRLLEGSVFAIKTFEHCFKWPLGEGSELHAHAYYKSDSAQQSLITLVHLVAKLLNTSHTTGLFNFSSASSSTAAPSAFGANDGFFTTSSPGANKPTSATASPATTTAELLKQLSPLTVKYNDTIVKLRTELAYVLHLALEWVAQDYSKIQNASYVRHFLVTMIMHRLTLPASGGDANFGGTTDDLVLKHIKAMMYNTATHQEYLLTLQAKSMQGVLGAGHHARYDGAASTLASQLQALELLNLLAHQHVSNGPVLQLVVQLLRQIERDYLWSEALETKSAFSCTVDDSLYKDTWSTPAGTQITKLPVSPVLKEQIFLTLRSALPLVPSSASKVWAAPLYTVQEIHTFLREGSDFSHVLALNDVDFGPTAAASPPAAAATTAVANDGFAPTVATLSPSQSKADALFDVPAVSHHKILEGTKIVVTEAALALLEFYRTNSGAHIADTSDYNQVRGLFSPLNAAYASSAIPATTYVCHADLLAQIADVQQSHLHCNADAPLNRTQANLSLVLPPATSADIAETSKTATLKAPIVRNPHDAEYEHSLLSIAMLPPREKFWTQLSGSADLLTVLAYSDIDLLSMTASIHVRVFNSSGFKIPTFALHLVAAGNLLSVDYSRGLASHTVALGSTITGNAASVVHQTQQHLLHSAGQGYSIPRQSIYFDESCVLSASGVDFFLPDAYIERTLTCKVRTFAPFEAVVRIVYADLVYDEDNIFEIPKEHSVNIGTARSSAVNKVTAAKKNKSANANASSRGARYMEEYKEKHSNKWSAVLDCEPLRVPISAQLLPYGYGTCSALRYWYNQHQSNHGRTVIAELQTAGIPETVFQNQWRRLGGRYECSAPVLGDVYLPQPPAATSAVASASARSGGHSTASPADHNGDSAFLAAQVNTQLEAAIRSAISTYGGTGMHLLGMDGKVCFDGLTSQRYTLRPYCDPALTSAAALGSVHSGSHALYVYAAWSLQTAQGAEVSVKIIIDTPAMSANHNSSDTNATTAVSMFDAMSLDALDHTSAGASDVLEWTGRMVVRCSDHATLQAVLSDLELFLYALTGGFVGLAEAV